MIEGNSEDHQNFYSETFGKVTLDKMALLIRDFMEEDPEKEYDVVIGTDSHERSNNGKSSITVVTALTIHREKSGGIYFYHKSEVDGLKGEASKKSKIRHKVLQETSHSLEFASNFIPLLQEKLNGRFPNLEIHIDVGERGETRDMIRQVVGMVTGSGYEAKIKPHSFGASHVADKHT